MHIPVEINITCTRGNTNKIKEFLSPNKLIYVIDISDTAPENQEETTLDISGIIFDDQDLTIIEKQLMFFGRVSSRKEKMKFFTQNTILSSLVVAGIVFIALLAHNFNEEFYHEIFVTHDIWAVLITALIVGSSAAAGFLLEMLIIYRERKEIHH